MSEQLSPLGIALGSYQTFVGSTQLRETTEDDWRTSYTDLIAQEQGEFLTDHGDGMSLLLPSSFNRAPMLTDVALRHDMADELGDVLWFGTSAALYADPQARLESACMQALDEFNISPETPLTTFNDVEQVAVANAGKIMFQNGLSSLFGEVDEFLRRTSLPDNPFYVYTRAFNRLSRSLELTRSSPILPSVTDYEPLRQIPAALGTFFLVAAYITHTRLEVPFSAVAEFNIAKLTNRREHGKQNDIHFGEWFRQNYPELAP